MDRETVLKHLEETKFWEDDFILKYDRESVWTLLEASLPEEAFLQIKRLLRENLADTVVHKSLLQKIVEDVKGGKYDP